MIENEVMKTCRKCLYIFAKEIIIGLCPLCGSNEIGPLHALRARKSFVDGSGGGP